MDKRKFVFTPPGNTQVEIDAGVSYPKCYFDFANSSGVLATWWPRLHQRTAETANAWAFSAELRLDRGEATGEEIRAEYLAKLAELCAESDRLNRVEREDYLARSIPPEYRQPIDRAKLKNPRAFDRVQLWTPNDKPPGLVVLGDTGRGKTRAVYHRLATLHREHGTKFLAFTADDVKRRLIAAALSGEVEVEHEGNETPVYVPLANRKGNYCEVSRSSRREPATLEGQLRAAGIVFVDDLSQTKLTPHYAEKLFALVEHRTARGLPLIVTAQMDGDRLARKLAGWEDQFADTATCLVRRLRDYCQPVNFGFDTPPS